MSKSAFYLLRVGRVAEPAATLFDPVDISEDGPPPRCPSCHGPVGMLTWRPPFVAELEPLEVEYGDIAKGPINDFLISERLKSLIMEEGIQGVSGLEPVEIKRVRRHRKITGERPAYYRMRVSIHTVALDFEASKIEYGRAPVCATCRSGNITAIDRLVVDQSTWNGEDLFTPRGLSGFVIVSQRFERLCRAHSIKNAFFIPLEEYCHRYI